MVDLSDIKMFSDFLRIDLEYVWNRIVISVQLNHSFSMFYTLSDDWRVYWINWTVLMERMEMK